MATQETKTVTPTQSDGLPTLKDWLCLVPGKLRDELATMASKAGRNLLTEDERKEAQINELKWRIQLLVRYNAEFCRQFLPFLQKQNEELRTIALAGSGSFVDAIPRERHQYNNYDPWANDFNPQCERGGSKFVISSTPTRGTAATAAVYISDTLVGYVNEFAANIVKKGRFQQVYAFVKRFKLSTTVEKNLEMRTSDLFTPYVQGVDNLINMERDCRFISAEKKITTRLEYFVHRFQTDDEYRTQVLADTRGKKGKEIPREVMDDNHALALFIFTSRMTDEDKSNIADEFKKWSHERETVDTREGEFREVQFEHLAGSERREAIRTAIQAHMERITCLTAQLTA
ncbi:MAG: hypothetical protein KGL39_40760 [Patescibacteria group bacterium]|nr:hypothetical protein [Patescibacteria group bacterium]